MNVFEILGFGGNFAGANDGFQLCRDGMALAPRRATYDEVHRDLLAFGGRRPYYIDRSGGHTSDGWRISWATLDRLSA